MPYLSSNQLKQYKDQGYISPIEVLSSSEAIEARGEIELIEKKIPNVGAAPICKVKRWQWSPIQVIVYKLATSFIK